MDSPRERIGLHVAGGESGHNREDVSGRPIPDRLLKVALGFAPPYAGFTIFLHLVDRALIVSLPTAVIASTRGPADFTQVRQSSSGNVVLAVGKLTIKARRPDCNWRSGKALRPPPRVASLKVPQGCGGAKPLYSSRPAETIVVFITVPVMKGLAGTVRSTRTPSRRSVRSTLWDFRAGAMPGRYIRRNSIAYKWQKPKRNSARGGAKGCRHSVCGAKNSLRWLLAQTARRAVGRDPIATTCCQATTCARSHSCLAAAACMSPRTVASSGEADCHGVFRRNSGQPQCRSVFGSGQRCRVGRAERAPPIPRKSLAQAKRSAGLG